jgi:hypothetical protein
MRRFTTSISAEPLKLDNFFAEWYDVYMNELFWYSRQLREAVSTTGMENGWNDDKCKEVFDELMDKYLVSKDLK